LETVASSGLTWHEQKIRPQFRRLEPGTRHPVQGGLALSFADTICFIYASNKNGHQGQGEEDLSHEIMQLKSTSKEHPTSWKGTKLTSVVSFVFAIHTVFESLASLLWTGANVMSLQ